jgi:hypothetical protein
MSVPARRARALGLALWASLAACTPTAPPNDAGADAGALDGAALDQGAPDAGPPSPACNPLGVAGGSCALPFPSAYYEVDDAASGSGVRVALTADALPHTRSGAAIDPAPWNRLDGFSPIGPFLAELAEHVDAATLVPPTDIARSLAQGAGSVLVDMETHALVAHFSEVDVNVAAGAPQVIFVRPAQRLRPGHRYAIALTRAVRTMGGAAPSVPPGFQAILDGDLASDPRLARIAPRYDAIFAALAAAGVARSEVVLAWDVVTASEASITAPMLAMRDDALAMMGPSGLGLTVTTVEDDFDARIARRIQGTFRAPSFLTGASGHEVLARDASGRPMISGVVDVPFVAMIPRSAATRGPLPMLQIGHGLFGGALRELGDATESEGYHQRLADDGGYVLFATDWIGLTQDDLAHVLAAMSDFGRMPEITERLMQAEVNAMVLYRTARARFAAEPAFAPGGVVAVDPSRVWFHGISLGGILGTTFMGYDPDCDRGALNVFGGVWSTLFQRNDGWSALHLAVGGAYPAPDDQQVLLALAQSLFDPTDPINLAPHLFVDRLPGVSERHLLFQEAVGDSAVSNLGTETVARTMGVPLVVPSVRTPYGLSTAMAPLPSALVIVDEMPTPLPPDTNGPVARTSTHITMRSEPAVEAQTRAFLAVDGVVTQTCSGACDPN